MYKNIQKYTILVYAGICWLLSQHTGTCSKGKSHKSKVVEELEEEEYYDPLAHHAIAILL